MFEEDTEFKDNGIFSKGSAAEDDALVAKVAFTVTNICAGGNHLTVSASVYGGASSVFVIDANEFSQPIAAEDLPVIVKYLMRTNAEGKTTEAAKTVFQLGLTVNV